MSYLIAWIGLVAVWVWAVNVNDKEPDFNVDKMEFRDWFDELKDIQKAPVNTSSGPIHGFLFQYVEDDIYQAWTDIPYAHPPVGWRRFRRPDVSITWDEPRNVSAKKPERCLQYNFILNDIKKAVGSEEACCMLSIYRYLAILHDNVVLFKDKGIKPQLAPVAVLIHPGTFMYDFEFDARRWAANLCCDFIIPVVVNYRLGPLGFLGTPYHRDDLIPSNLGLFDQVAALKWVRKNIRSFYGNPKQVTLIGVAAGAAAIQLHQLSPYSKGLFHRAISYSGSALVPWALADNVTGKTLYFGKTVLNCEPPGVGLSFPQLVECMRQANISNYKSHLQKLKTDVFYDWKNTPLSPLGPVIDHDFLPDHPWIMLAGGNFNKVPHVFSIAESAGLIPAHLYVDTDVLRKTLDQKWELLAPSLLDYKNVMYESLHGEFARRVYNYYMKGVLDIKGKPITGKIHFSDHHITNLIKILTDRLYTTGIVEAARLAGLTRRDVPVFLYKFSVVGNHSYGHDLLKSNKFEFGPPAGDDFLVYIANQYPLRTRRDHKLRTTMTEMFLAFCIDHGKASFPTDAFNYTDKDYTQTIKLDNMIDVNHWLDDDGKPTVESRAKAKAHTVSYQQIIAHDRIKTSYSNNLGHSRFWRRAPFISPYVNERFGLYSDIYEED